MTESTELQDFVTVYWHKSLQFVKKSNLHKRIFTLDKDFVYVELKILEYVLFVVTNRCFSGSEAVKSGLLLLRY